MGEETEQDDGEKCGAGIRHFAEALGEESERIGSGWRRGQRSLRVEKGKGLKERRSIQKHPLSSHELLGARHVVYFR